MNSEESTRKLISAFTLITLVIMSLGLIGVISFELRRRIKELAIRKVLGAYFMDLLAWMTKPYAILMGAGIILVAPVCYYLLLNWLNNYAYRADFTVSIFVFPLLVIVLVLITTVTLLVNRYSGTNPVSLLRDE